MRFISTSAHGVLDYLTGVLLIGAPWLLGFANNGPETWIPVTLGISVIVYSLMTRFEWGAIKVIPMSVHLWLDAISGLFLAASPWLFNFDERVYLPHLLVGIFEVMVAMFTMTRSYNDGVEINTGSNTGTYTRTTDDIRTDTSKGRSQNRDWGSPNA